MSNYFRYLPKEFYLFGDESTPDVFPNLALYADVIDQIKDSVTLYGDITIQDNERPDQTSFRLYGTADFHWTFFLMNNKLREQGWPLSNAKAETLAKRRYPNQVITTRTSLTSLTGFFKTGDTITGRTSGVSSTIIHRNLDLGQIFTTGEFQAGEEIETSGTSSLVNAFSVTAEHLAAHHYIDGDKVITDIDPTVGPGGLLTEVTFLDRVNEQNSDLRQIRIIKPGFLEEIVQSFREAVSA
jgi:hypothetical protein